MRRPITERLKYAVIASLSLYCGDSAEPDLGTLAYEMVTGCVPSVLDLDFTCSPQQTTVARGDSLLVAHFLVDTSVAMTATARVRGPCAVNFEIRRRGVPVGTLPADPTCPDSVAEQGDNPPLVNNRRFYFWNVPADATPGSYTITSVLLVEPQGTRAAQITVE